MDIERIVRAIQSWGQSQDAFDAVEAPVVTATDFSAKVRTIETREVLTVRGSASDSRLYITHQLPVPSALELDRGKDGDQLLADAVIAVESTRPGVITCTLQQDRSAHKIHTQALIYEDGFSRHTLNSAVLDVARTIRALTEQMSLMIDSARMKEEVEQDMKQRRAQIEAEAAAAAKPAPSREPAPVAEAYRPAASAPRGGDGSPRNCESCGTPLTAGVKFCSGCGRPATAAPPVSSAPSPGTCPNPACRKPVPPGQKFCNACGTAVRSGGARA